MNSQVFCVCGNEARYINERAEICCALCPLGEGIDSIRLNNVPRLLAWAREHVENESECAGNMALRDIVQKKR